MSDIFALVPRNLAGDFFGAVASFYAGDNVSTETCGNNVDPRSSAGSRQASERRRRCSSHVHSHRVPVQPTDFKAEIVRATGGAVRRAPPDASRPLRDARYVRTDSNARYSQPKRDDAAAMCEALLTGWWWRRCAARFPPARGSRSTRRHWTTRPRSTVCSVDVGDMPAESRARERDVPARVSRWTWCAITDHGRNRRGARRQSSVLFRLNMPMIPRHALLRALLEPVLRRVLAGDRSRPVTARAPAARLSTPGRRPRSDHWRRPGGRLRATSGPRRNGAVMGARGGGSAAAVPADMQHGGKRSRL